MKLRKFKRSFAMFLIFLLAFSNMAYAAPGSANPANGKPILADTSQPTKTFENSVSETVTEGQYGPNDIVRIVVELEKAPAISYATEQGVRYKDLADSVQAQLQEEVLASQEAAKAAISSMGIALDVEYNFTTAFNGFSSEVTYKEVSLIKTVPGVADVHISNVYTLPEEQEPNMKYSLDIVKAMETWADYGYDGEGMIIGIIDTGIDPWHADMALDEGVEISLTEDMVKELRADPSNNLDGIFFTDKVPFGYNYMDKNTQILEQGPSVSSHGMHVAGTVAANGEIQGVAPNAQLLALRVFGDDPLWGSTYGDIYVKAIDDAILLGADVINLSLGSVAAFVRPEDPEQQAIARAVENGLVAAISAGNSAHFSNALGAGNPFASNPDIGLTGAPSLSHDSIGVASFENSHLEMEGFAWTAGDEEGTAAFLASNNYHLSLDEPQELVHVVHNGSIDTLNANLAAADVEGKFVMLERGLPFIDKTLAIQAAGGAGAIVFNHSAGYTQMATDSAIKIPQVFISREDGQQLRAILAEGTEVLIEFGGEKVVGPNPAAGQLSSFTSWGSTPNLDFKPEISAPGGNILSTLQGGGYGLKSGTSMAAPHVAGGSALVLQRVDEHFNLSGKARAEKAKSILLNTSTIITDKGLYNNHFGLGNPYSPRRQGSGLMDLHAAMATPVVVTEVTSGEAKAALKEVGDVFSFTLQAENFGTEDVTYQVNGNVQTDLVLNGRNIIEAQGVYKAGTISDDAPWLGEYPIAFSANEITVPAGGTVEFTVTIDLNDTIEWMYNAPLSALFPNGTFIEGFVTLTDASEANPALAVPYVGFYGQWDKAPIIDAKRYEGGNFLTWTGLANEDGTFLNPIAELDGFDGVNNILAFSPNQNGVNDKVNPALTFLRNAADVQYNILNANGDRLRTIKLEKDVRKNHAAPGYSFVGNRAWDGKVNRSVVADGLYYYEVRSRVDFEGARWQSVQFPVLVDTVAPELTAEFDFVNKVINWEATEEASGLHSVTFLVDGEEHSSVVFDGEFEQSGSFNISGLKGTTVDVVVADRAGNYSVETIADVNDGTVPFIYVDSPSPLTAYDSLEVPVSGHIVDVTDIAKFKVNGEIVEVTFNEETKNFDFDTTVSFEEDGAPDVFFEVTDVLGNYVSIKRQIIVDTTVPELEVEAPAYFIGGDATVDVSVSVSDNFNELSLFVNGSQEYFNALRAPYGVSDFSDEFVLSLPLSDGDVTTFEIELVDVAGNVTEETVTIDRFAAVTSPAQYEIFDAADVAVTGFVEDPSDVAEVKVNGVVVDLTADEFSTTVTLVDGANEIDFSFENTSGEVLETTRTVFVDTTPAVLTVDAPAETYNEEETLSIGITDNFDRIQVLVNDEVKFNQRFAKPYDVRPFAEAMNFIVPLELGSNDFNIKVIDLAGNVTEETVTIERLVDPETLVNRLAGQTRFDTAALVSAEGWDASDVVILTRSDDFVDALSGVPLAKKLDAPILLTRTGSLPQATADEIERLGASEVIILGGHLAVSEAVEAQLEALDLTVTRIAGQTRWETSALIAHEVAPNGTDEAVVVYGRDFADALAIAPYAAANGMPVLLTDKNQLPKATADALDALGVTTTYALGGHLVMSEDVFNALPGGQRFAGQTRFNTALMVINHFDPGADHFFVATVNDFTDALAGAALAAKLDTGVFLVGNSVREDVKTYITDNGVETLTVLGGELAISADVYDQLVGIYRK